MSKLSAPFDEIKTSSPNADYIDTNCVVYVTYHGELPSASQFVTINGHNVLFDVYTILDGENPILNLTTYVYDTRHQVVLPFNVKIDLMKFDDRDKLEIDAKEYYSQNDAYGFDLPYGVGVKVSLTSKELHFQRLHGKDIIKQGSVDDNADGRDTTRGHVVVIDVDGGGG